MELLILNKIFSLAFILFLAAACSVGPSYKPASVETPSAWKNHQSKECEEEIKRAENWTYLDYWWQVFDDKKLEELELWAIQNNRNLFVAYERIQEARALMGIAAADFYPQVTLNPFSSNTVDLIKNYRNIRNSSSPCSGASDAGNTATNSLLNTLNNINKDPFRVHEMLYALPVNASYEVDLWGKIRDQYDSATYQWLAEEKDYEAVMLSLTTYLATVYYQLRVADAQLDLLLNVLKTRRKAFEINRDRYEEEIVFYADVTLAGEEVNEVIRQYDEIRRQRDVLEDQMAVLIGVPASEFCLEHLPLQGKPPCIPAGIPSEVLLRRPDVAEAEYQMKSDHALVKKAYTQFFPSLILTAAIGFESPLLRDFLSWISRYWMDQVQVNQLIFDGGKTYSNLKLQVARFQEASGSYQQQVLVAFQEVEDALANLDSYAKQYEVVLATTKWAQKTYQLYSDRYLLGVIYYIDVANSERDLLNYQITLNALQGSQYLATIQFIKALGGGF